MMMMFSQLYEYTKTTKLYAFLMDGFAFKYILIKLPLKKEKESQITSLVITPVEL